MHGCVVRECDTKDQLGRFDKALTLMDTLRKLTSIGRSKKEEGLAISQQKETVKEEASWNSQTNVKEELEDRKKSHFGLTPNRAPISMDVEEGEGEDGEESYGSGNSFDSALERIAASSTASVDFNSPVGSLVGQSEFDMAAQGLVPEQQGALMRLNEMASGEASLDTTLIDNCTEEEFRSNITDVARNREIAKDDPSIFSILNALLPLVRSRAGFGLEEREDRDDQRFGTEKVPDAYYDNFFDESDGEEETESEAESSATISSSLEEGEELSRFAIPVAKLTDADEDQGEEVYEEEEGDEDEESVSSEELEFEEADNGGIEDLDEGENSDVGLGKDENSNVAELLAATKDEGAARTQSVTSDVASAKGGVIAPAAPEESTDGFVKKREEFSLAPSVSSEESNEESDFLDYKKSSNNVSVMPSPAGLYVAKEAIDKDISAMEESVAENRDSDTDVEDEDDEDDEDEERGDTDMETARLLAELATTVGKSGASADTASKLSLGAAGPSLRQRPTTRKTVVDSAGRMTQCANGATTTQPTTTTNENSNVDGSDGNDKTREELQNIRVKFLRLAHRLGQSPQNVVVAQVLYRLGLAEQLRGGRTTNQARAFSFEQANVLAEEQEATSPNGELDFECTILFLGKTGVGKSATINSIFDECKSGTDAFSPSTKKVQEIVGAVHGIKVRIIDTPGLLPSVSDEQHNERIMGSVKKYICKSTPDIVLYFDRLDMQSRDYGDLPLLQTITDIFGAAVWFNAIVALTHASSAPPDGSNGVPLSYEMFIAQRSHVIQQSIRQAAGDMRLMNPVSLVENHPSCRTNRTGQRVLPNGQIWKPQLLLLCFASKILAEANSLLKLQDTTTSRRPFGQRPRVPPLPFLLSSLLQSRAQLKMPNEQMGDEDESDEDSGEDDSDTDEYDDLPPFRLLSKEELKELSNEQKQQYFEELADREKMFQKKQWRQERRRRKEMKKRATAMSKEEISQPTDEADDEAGKAAAVPVPMPDMALPPSFDSDNSTHRYRYLETTNQWLVRPVLETHGWDHDAGYDGFNCEKMFVVKDKIPASIQGQITKDKKESQVNFEAAASLKHGEGKVTLTGFDVQTIGKDLAYTLRAETSFNNFKRNKTTAGLTFTLLDDTIAAGLKLEDRLVIGKRLKMVVNGGVLTGRGEKAFGGSLEATHRGKDYLWSRTFSTLGLSVMEWHGDLAIGGNLQSQLMLGKTMMVARGNLNNRGAGQISLRASSSEQLQMVLIGIVPILRSLINSCLVAAHPSQ